MPNSKAFLMYVLSVLGCLWVLDSLIKVLFVLVRHDFNGMVTIGVYLSSGLGISPRLAVWLWVLLETVLGNLLMFKYFPLKDLLKINSFRTSEFREILADLSHLIWSHWMKYMFSSAFYMDGSISGIAGSLIPSELDARWRRQMNTDYPDLTEKEKESDREQADKILKALGIK